MSAQVSSLPLPAAPPTAAPADSLAYLPCLPDESWLSLNNLLSSQPPSDWSSTPQSSQSPTTTGIRKRRNQVPPIRHAAPLGSDAVREEADRRKRENFLARNRRAATRCRQRKRQFVRDLETKYEEASARKEALETEFTDLQKEVLELKDELLRHSLCADPPIQNYLAGMVKSVKGADPSSPGLGPSCVSFGDETGGCTPPVGGCEGYERPAKRPRRDSVYSVSTDASWDSFINEGLFEQMLNFA